MQTPVVERYGDGEIIITEGIMSQKAYIVMSGEVAISKRIGNRNVTIGRLTEGDIFGEMGLFQEQVRSATATAKGDVALGIISKEYFMDMLNSCPDDMKTVVNSLIDRLRRATDKLAGLGLKLEQVQRSLDAFSTKEMD